MFASRALIAMILSLFLTIKALNLGRFKRHALFSSAQSPATNTLDAIESTVMHYVSSKCKVSANSFVLLSVSGGIDSMAMLHILSAISTKIMPLNLEVISFNHKLRQESDEEVSFVSSWAAKYGLKFHERILPENKRSLVGLQASAREWRREECFNVLSDHERRKSEDKMQIKHQDIPVNGAINGDLIGAYKENVLSVDYILPVRAVFATAHHADDQHETVLLKFLRGAYISHLQPMSPRSDCSRIIHPLLSVSKADLEAYMIANNFTWRDDSSNLLRKYKRNVVRLDLLPVMSELAGGPGPLTRRFSALAEQSVELQSWLDSEANRFLASNFPNIDCPSSDGKDKKKERAIDHRVSEVALDAKQKSPFSLLPSPLVKREVLQRIYKYLSLGEALSYEVTCQLLNLITDGTTVGKREKVLHLSRDIYAVKIGDFLLFKIREISIPKDVMSDFLKPTHNSDGNFFYENGDKKDPELKDNKNRILFKGITMTFPKDFHVTIKEIYPGEIKFSKTENTSGIVSPYEKPEIEKPEKNVFYKNSEGLFLSNGRKCSSFCVPIYGIPHNSDIDIRFPIDGDRFQPSWRKDPIRVVHFLRGQKVPLHVRRNVPMIVLTNKAKKSINIEMDISQTDAIGCAVLRGNLSDNVTGDAAVRSRVDVDMGVQNNDSHSFEPEIISIPPFVAAKYEHSTGHFNNSIDSASPNNQEGLVSIELTFQSSNIKPE